MTTAPTTTVNEDDEVAEQADEVIDSVTACVERESGAWCHVFLDDSNRCQCGERKLMKYRPEEQNG